MNPDWPGVVDLSASSLAEAATPENLRALLAPLIDGYKAWIDRSFDPAVHHHHQELRALAIDAHRRMQSGLDVLLADSDARLAFNMANQAVEVSNRWRGDSLIWRKVSTGFLPFGSGVRNKPSVT